MGLISRYGEMSQPNQVLKWRAILGDLTSPEKEIREAAIEAAKQFGDTNAIPVLKALAANDADNQEAIEMLQAADFIALPEAPLVQHSNAPLTPEQQQRRLPEKPDRRKVARNTPDNKIPKQIQFLKIQIFRMKMAGQRISKWDRHLACQTGWKPVPLFAEREKIVGRKTNCHRERNGRRDLFCVAADEVGSD